MKTAWITFTAILFLPLLVIGVFQKNYPSDPDIVYIKAPSLFAGKWQKVAFSENFSEYIDPDKFEKNIDATIDIVTMRNYFVAQTEDDKDQNHNYHSQISYETVDCFNQTVTVNKMFLLGNRFAAGSLVAEPIEPPSTPIRLNAGSIGLRKVLKVCELANGSNKSEHIKSSFMNNI